MFWRVSSFGEDWKNLWVWTYKCLVLICFLGLPLLHDRTNLHPVTFAIKSVLKSLTMEKLWFCEREVFTRKCSLSYDRSYLLHWSEAFWFILLKIVSPWVLKSRYPLSWRKKMKWQWSLLHKEPRMWDTYGFLSANIFCPYLLYFSFSFRNLLGVGGNSLAAPNLLNTSSRRNSGVFQAAGWNKESSCEQKEFGPNTTKDFFKFLVKWSFLHMKEANCHCCHQ